MVQLTVCDLNERNHASCDITIKKLIEEKKVASWTHKTNVNKLSYTPLQFVTQKSCNLPSALLLETEGIRVPKFLHRYSHSIFGNCAPKRSSIGFVSSSSGFIFSTTAPPCKSHLISLQARKSPSFRQM